ncbi:biotin/lipoyl-binding protein [Pandoraea sputorum]|uniref:biotin/lipoyl-binding protein n=1 Tax=Pandoraea sputorum TaxID=93222 RepID=UPI0012558F4F|nr:biotin/lipoyl-binding protein [Pandoraea sputorum]VVE75038.1 p-hydroxybenzoic acid efflux pump subunit AaeA [Pandoraea sputorum]
MLWPKMEDGRIVLDMGGPSVNHLFYFAGGGILAAILRAFLFGLERRAEPPVVVPVASPYPEEIYAAGIVEGVQGGGGNIKVYPEVSGVVSRVLVHEGDTVHAGELLLQIDDSVQRATTGQLHAQMLAAEVTLEELKTEPRQETLAVAKAQVDQEQANLNAAQNQ